MNQNQNEQTKENKMNMVNEPKPCEEQEIPAKIRRHETLIEETFELLNLLGDKINPVLSTDCIKSGGEDTKTQRLSSPLGNWLNDQNIKIESANETLRDLYRRVML